MGGGGGSGGRVGGRGGGEGGGGRGVGGDGVGGGGGFEARGTSTTAFPGELMASYCLSLKVLLTYKQDSLSILLPVKTGRRKGTGGI